MENSFDINKQIDLKMELGGFVDDFNYYKEDGTLTDDRIKMLAEIALDSTKRKATRQLKSKIEDNSNKLKELSDKYALLSDEAEKQELSTSINTLKSNIEETQNTIDNISNNDTNVNYKIHLKVERRNIFDNKEELIQMCKALGSLCKNATINIEVYENIYHIGVDDAVSYTYTTEQFKQILELEQQLNSDAKNMDGNRVGIFFNDEVTVDEETFEKHVSLEGVCQMNSDIDKIVDFIKEKQFTPYEAMIYIHNYLTSFTYNKGESQYDHDIAQTIVGPLLTKNKNIICSGFSSLCKAIIDRLNMSGLECKMVSLRSFDVGQDNPEFLGAHSICMITINDEKYGINGEYYNDASNDNKRFEGDWGRFLHFLYPTSDNNLQSYERKVSNGDESQDDMYESAPKVSVEVDVSRRFSQTVKVFGYDYENSLEKVKDSMEFYGNLDTNKVQALWEKTKPIPTITLAKGLYNVLKNSSRMREEYDNREIVTIIYHIIVESMEKGLILFRPEAIGGIMHMWRAAGYYSAEDKEACKEATKKMLLKEIFNYVYAWDHENTDKDEYGRK